jgi:hypothetical protein
LVNKDDAHVWVILDGNSFAGTGTLGRQADQSDGFVCLTKLLTVSDTVIVLFCVLVGIALRLVLSLEGKALCFAFLFFFIQKHYINKQCKFRKVLFLDNHMDITITNSYV